jgi:hypothetical protein
MPWPAHIQEAEERMKQAVAALLADTESGEPYNAERRHRLLAELEHAMDDFLDKISHLRQWLNQQAHT